MTETEMTETAVRYVTRFLIEYLNENFKLEKKDAQKREGNYDIWTLEKYTLDVTQKDLQNMEANLMQRLELDYTYNPSKRKEVFEFYQDKIYTSFVFDEPHPFFSKFEYNKPYKIELSLFEFCEK